MENVLERAINVVDGSEIQVSHLPLYIVDQEVKREDQDSNDSIAHKSSAAVVKLLKDTIEKAEKKAILHALHVTDGNKLEAAKLLGVGKTKFYDKCKVFGI